MVVYAFYHDDDYSKAIDRALAHYPNASVVAIPKRLRRIMPDDARVIDDIRNLSWAQD